MHQNRGMRCLLACLLILLSFNSAANDASHKLSEILAKIHNVKELLLRHQSEQVNLEKNLQKTELAINHVSQQLQKTLSDLSQKKRTISELTVNQHVLEDKIKEQQIILLKEIRLTYLLGLNKNKFQFILESKDPDKIHRLITYNHYLSLRNHHMITHLKNDLVNLNENKKTILLHVNHLADMQKDQTLQQKQLDSHKQNQKLVLNNLSLKVKSHQEQLDELLKNKKNLESVINRLQKKENYSSDYLTHHTGHFPWPTTGKIIEKFGRNIQNSELKQNGVLILAPEGQKVYAVAPGKVIFANWLPGYGLLLILDHGKGYMTLYGNNGTLYKKTHDLVNNHELIASVGHTGGQQKSALYFALRYKGKPIDPGTWCH